MERTNLNMKMQSILENVNNIEKVYGIELMSSQYEYLLHHLFVMTIATTDQLSKVINLERSKIVMSMSHGVSKGLLESQIFMYNGNPTSWYSLTTKGKKYISPFFLQCAYDIKHRPFKKQLEHFIEAGSLYYAVYNECESVEFSREQTHTVCGVDVLRPDAEIIINYGTISEHFYIEHDRGTETKKVLLDKLNLAYGLYIMSGETVNLVFTVSREQMVKNKKAKEIAESSSVRKLTELVKILRSTKSVMSKLSFEDIEMLVDAIEDYYSDSPDPNHYAIINDNINLLTRFLEINQEMNLQTKEDVLSKYHEEDTNRKIALDNATQIALLGQTTYRVNQIIDAIVDSDDLVEVKKEYLMKNSEILSKHAINDSGSTYIPSFKSLLLENELIIDTLHSTMRYFDKRTFNIRNSKSYFEVLFDLEGQSFDYCSVTFNADGKTIKKNISSGILTIGSKKVALVILEPSVSLSDKLKLELMISSKVTHNYDSLRVIVLSRQRTGNSDFLEYEDVIEDQFIF